MPWFVIYTQPRSEKKVVERLEVLGVKAYCPMVIQTRQWSDRKKKVLVPLINSYIFVNIEENERSLVLQIDGVVRYLFWQKKPAIVRDEEIDALKDSLKATLDNIEIYTFQEGDVMNINTGPFKGKEGIIKQVNNNSFQLVLKELGMLITISKELK